MAGSQDGTSALRAVARRLAARLASVEHAPEAELRAATSEVRAALSELASEGADPAAESQPSKMPRLSGRFGSRVHRLPANPFERLMPLMHDKETLVMCQGVPPDSLFPLRSMEFSLKAPLEAPSLQSGYRGAAASASSSDGSAVLGATADSLVHIGEADTQLAQRYAPFAWGALKSWIEAHVREVHAPASPDWTVALAAGSMSSVDISVAMFFDPGDSVLIEEYSFLAAVDAFLAAGVRLVSVRGDERGLNAASLRIALTGELAAGRPRPKGLYIIPVGQNPLGTRLAEERYREIYEACSEEHVTILEDDAYFYQQHNAHDDRPDDDSGAVAGVRGLGPVSFLTIDTAGIVLRMDSFSKVLAPGFRLGWVTGPQHFIKTYQKLGYVSSQHGASLSMICLGAVLQRWGPEGFASQVCRLQLALRLRCRALLRACDSHLKGVAEWGRPGAGMFLWLRLVNLREFTHEELLELMRQHKVAAMPGGFCATARSQPDGPADPFLRISYVLPEDKYDEGMRRLRLVLDHLRA